MKPKKEIIIAFKSLDELALEAIKAIKQRKSNIQPKNTIFFDNWASFRGFMTLQKVEVLMMISNVAPKSIYELSRLLDRSLAAVQKDCEALEQVGFIKLTKQSTGRGSIIPTLVFNYEKIIVKLPHHPYELTFRAAA